MGTCDRNAASVCAEKLRGQSGRERESWPQITKGPCGGAEIGCVAKAFIVRQK